MICPFCQTFTGVSTKVAKFCEHLNTCRKDSDGTSSITCTHCKRFRTCDLVRFSEHFGTCKGPKEKLEDVIPINNRIFKCDACIHLSYFTFPDFLQHYIYHQRFTYRCTFVEKNGSLCTARRDAFSNMNVHLKIKHMKNTDEDAQANFVIDTTLPSMVWLCHLCNSRFHSMDQRDAHLKSEHSSVTTSKCSICDHCPFASVIPEDIQIHMTTDHSQLVGYTDKFRRISYQCEICEEYHSTLKALNRHKWFTHKVGEGLVKLRHACPDCPKRFVVENQLIAHQIREHARADLGKDPLECDECHGKFNTINSLRSHIRTIHEKAGGKFCCEICGTAVASKQVLKKHLYRIHRIGSVKEIVCPDCGKSYDCLSNFKCHVATHHVKTALFNCEFCGKGYFKQRDLKNHLLLHKFPDLKVFSCELCPGKKFRTTDNLSVHWKKGHSPEESQWLRNKGIREEEREEFLRVVGNDFTRVKMLFKTCSK